MPPLMAMARSGKRAFMPQHEAWSSGGISRFSFGLRPSSQALRAWMAKRAHARPPPPSRGRPGSTTSGSCSSTPMPALHRHRHRPGRLDHRRGAVGDERRGPHQRRAEAARLHPVGRAADVEVDLVEPHLPPDRRRRRQLRRHRPAELQRQRPLLGMEGEQPLPVAAQHGAGGDHLGIEQRPPREAPVEEAAVPVGPVHHRGDGQADGVDRLSHCMGSFADVSERHMAKRGGGGNSAA